MRPKDIAKLISENISRGNGRRESLFQAEPTTIVTRRGVTIEANAIADRGNYITVAVGEPFQKNSGGISKKQAYDNPEFIQFVKWEYKQTPTHNIPVAPVRPGDVQPRQFRRTKGTALLQWKYGKLLTINKMNIISINGQQVASEQPPSGIEARQDYDHDFDPYA